MAVTFNELLEGTELSEEVRGSIQEAWDSKLSEAKEQLTAELREEFAQRSEEHSLNSSHITISYAVFCLKKKKK